METDRIDDHDSESSHDRLDASKLYDPDPAPDGPAALPRRAWQSALKDTVTVFRKRGVTNWAAALTYFGVLALFPALIALVSMLGMIGSSAINPLLEQLTTAAPGPARDLLAESLTSIQANPGASGVTFFIGLAAAIWAASGYISAFMDASNAIYGVEETRPFWKKIPLRLAVTVVELVLVSACAIAVVLTGDLAQRAGDIVGVGDTAVDIWNIAKWPVLILVLMLALAILYWAAPNARHPGFRWITPGSILAVVLWIVASAAFGAYVAAFGSYNKTYGALGGGVVFLIWLWISNIAVLLGAALNS
ncbi:MAG: YihY/virulence factor BrkB family protein, partial [Solirubrobacterales bacterium]